MKVRDFLHSGEYKTSEVSILNLVFLGTGFILQKRAVDAFLSRRHCLLLLALGRESPNPPDIPENRLNMYDREK